MTQAPQLLNPFVGREYEQKLYRQFLMWKTPWVMVITGNSGIGKSTLLRRLAEQTPQEILALSLDFAILELRTDPLRILEELAWKMAADCDAQRLQAFEQTLDAGRATLEELGAQARVIEQKVYVYEQASAQGLQLNINTAMLEQRREVRKRVTKAFYALMLTLKHPQLVLFLDTSEWLLEPEGLEVGQWVLNELLPELHARLYQRGKHCSVVIASREKLSISAILRHDQYALLLTMLNSTDVDNYLMQMGMQDATLRQRIYGITHGHALCVSILGTLWQERGEHPFTLADLPELQNEFSERVLLEFIQERLEQRLSSPFRELTRYGVLLRTFDLPMLQAVFPPDLLPDNKALDIFQRLIHYPHVERRGNSQYAFHDLLREIQVPHIRKQEPKVWERYHRRALDYLRQKSPLPPDWYYYAIASDEQQGMDDWWDAVQEAQLHGSREYLAAVLQAAHDGTLDLTERSCATRAYLQGRYYYYGAEMAAALASYEQALELFRQVGDRLGEANVLQAIGDVQQFRKDMKAALASYEQALELFRQVGDRLGEANVLQAIGDVQQFRDEREAALASYEQALELFRQVGDRLGEANVLQAIGDVQQFRKDMKAALASYEQALELFRQVGSKLGEANVRKAIGDVQQFRKDMKAALASYEQALELFRQVGDRLGEANVLQAIGDVQQFRKDMKAALASYEQALELFRQVGSKLGEANVRKAIGDVQQFRDEREAALASYEQALELFRQVGSKLGEANVRKAIGDVQQFRDEREAALASYEQALELFRQVGDRLGEANVLQAIGDVQQFRDEREAALASYEQALELFRQVGSKLGEANVLQAIGDVQQFRDEREAALASYEQALELFRQVGDRLGEANVRKAIGDVQQFRKDMKAALASYEQALELFRQVGDRLGEANCYLAQGRVALRQEAYEEGLKLHTEAYHLYQHMQDRYSQARLLYYRSFVYEARDEQQLAIKDVETALLLAQQLDLPFVDIFSERLDELKRSDV